jgi:hypothetical protein
MRFSLIKNACFNMRLLEYINYTLPTCPFWTGILLGTFERYNLPSYPTSAVTFKEVKSRTQGHIDNYFKNLKFDDFRGRKHLRADEFLLQQYSYLDNRIVAFAEECRMKKNLKTKETHGQKETEWQNRKESKTYRRIMRWLKDGKKNNQKE